MLFGKGENTLVKELSPAKVNLALDIVGQRPDGYHEMKMINHSIGLADELFFFEADTLSLTCSDPQVPLGEKNLVWKAAEALRRHSGCSFGAEIRIEKHIPMEAGLAGGSANAAAALRGLNRLWHLELSMDDLQKIGASIGADVPYCVVNGTALVEGFGDVVIPLSPLPSYPMVVVKPDVDISTPAAFKMTDDYPDLFHPDVIHGADILKNKGLFEALPYFGNSFEEPIFQHWPVIGEIKGVLRSAGAFYAAMSGSGSTVVSYFEDLRQAETVGKNLSKDGYRVFVTQVC